MDPRLCGDDGRIVCTVNKNVMPAKAGIHASPSRANCPLRVEPHAATVRPVSNAARVGLGILFFVLFVALWGWATLGGYVSKAFLADL